ncbi:TolC family protein [Robertkochia solimangrovi]|uniref:TolC family protein n=1 Tax=Robertkochia solimangrovi TaxID=2213046 RepID=UPI00117F943A|nr:TolC family protein [Robertkochia solimangrovi]
MKPIYRMILATVFLFAIKVSAQSPRHLSLSEAIDHGLDNSKAVKLALSRVRGAEASTHEMRDKRLPDLTASGQYLMLNEPNISLGSGLAGNADGNADSGESGSFTAPKYLMLGQASLSIPLFSGFRISNGIRSAEYLEKAAGLDAASQTEETVMNIVDAYVNLYKAQQAVALVAEDLVQAKQRVKDFTNMMDNGLLAKNDLLSAKLMESNTSLALLDARNNARIANYNMDLLLGFADDTQLELENLNNSDLPLIAGKDDWRENAMTDRKDLQAMDEREKASEMAVKIAKGSYYPSLALTGGYIAADIDNVATLTNALSVGVGVNFDISNLFKGSSKVHQAKEQQLQTQIMKDQLTDQVKSQVFSSYSNYQEAVERIHVYETAREQAEENYRIVKSKHENSLVTTTELLDADIDQFQARLNLEYARVDAVAAYCRLLQVSGKLNSTSVNNLIEE